MRKLILKYVASLVLICLSYSSLFAQIRTTHTGAAVTIGTDAIVTIKGDLSDFSTVTVEKIENKGLINLKGNLDNQGSNFIFGTTPITGRLQFSGLLNDTIRGINQINFCNLHVNLPANNLIIDGKVQVNDSLYFIDGNVFLRGDTLVMNYFNSSTTNTPSGIIGETNLKRIFGPNYPVVVQNYPWNFEGTYSFVQLKGIGIDFKVNDALGPNFPFIYRYNLPQQCGPLIGSVARNYKFGSLNNEGLVGNVTARYHEDSERTNIFDDGDSMHIYISTASPQVWRDIEGDNSGPLGTVQNSTYKRLIGNNTIYTITKDSCDSIPAVYVHQILNVSDTIFQVDSALFCDGSSATATLIADGSPGDYLWITPTDDTIVGSLNGQYIANQLGTYTLICTNVRGCDNRKEFSLVDAPDANADFVATSLDTMTFGTPPYQACDLTTINFDPVTTISTSSYYWDFGDGTDSTMALSSNVAVDHLYSTTGEYTVSLSVTTNAGCISTETIVVKVNSIPVAEFGAGTACEDFPVSFDNQTTNNDPFNAVSLNWDFMNDGVVDGITQQFPGGGDTVSTYTTANIYSVSLFAVSMGCVSPTVTHDVTVFAQPVPSFDISAACQGAAVSFTNTTDTTNQSPTTFLWNFNTVLGGPTSTFENPSYLYSDADDYNVSLQATTVHGCVAVINSTVTVDQNPVSNFALTNVCENTEADFIDNSSVVTPSTIDNWSWVFGDGNSSTFAQDTTYAYTANGVYTVSLTVETPQGCTSTSSQTITVFDGPTAFFDVTPKCEGTTFDVFNSSSNGNQYAWSVPDLFINNDPSTNLLNLTFSVAGNHDIELLATSINGCENTYVGSVLINPLPIDNFNDTTTTCGLTNILDAQYNSTNLGSTFLWNTGSTSPAITVSVATEYRVIITTAFFCTITDTTYAELNVPITPYLGDDGDQCDSAVLNAGSYGQGTFYTWSYASPSLPTTFVNLSNTTNELTVILEGIYAVEIVDGNNCIGTDTINVNILPSTPVNLGDPEQDTCLGATYTLTSDIVGGYLWSDGSTNSTLEVTAPGSFWIEVTAGGCSSRDTVEVDFVEIPVFSLNSITEACDSMVLNAFAGLGVTYEWSTLNGNTESKDTVYNTNTYWVDVELTSTGCVIRDSIDVTIYNSPIINLPNDTSICSYQQFTIDQGNSPSDFTFIWNTGSTDSAIVVASTGNYSVEVFNSASQCSTSGSINVVSLPLFNFDLGNDVPFCEGSLVEISADVTLTNAQYNWFDYSGTLKTTESFTLPDTGTYYLEITNEYGCQAIDSIDALPSNLSLYAIFLADSEVEPGTSVQFVNLSYPKPFTSSWDFGDGTPIVSDSMPIHPFYIALGEDSSTYEVTLSLNNGVCNSSLTKPIKVKIGAKVEEDPPYSLSLYTSILEALVYPNPNDGDFTLRIRLENTAPIQVDVFNLMGQLIQSDSFIAKEINQPYSLNKILPGMYLVRVKAGSDQQTVKFIKIYR